MPPIRPPGEYSDRPFAQIVRTDLYMFRGWGCQLDLNSLASDERDKCGLDRAASSEVNRGTAIHPAIGRQRICRPEWMSLLERRGRGIGDATSCRCAVFRRVK